MTSWPTAPLGSLAEVRGGGTPSRADPNNWNGDVPWISPKDMKVARLSDAEEHVSSHVIKEGRLGLLPRNSVLVVVRGMILARAVPVAIADVPLTINQDIKALACNGHLEPNYLLSVLRGAEAKLLGRVSTAAHGTKKLDTKDLLSFPVPLPPLDEQRRIVDRLERAAGIRRLREQALAKARAIVPALFLDMFGDPASNPKGWPRRALGSLIAGLQGGRNLQSGDEGVSPFRILRISAVTGGTFRPEESKPAPFDYTPPPEHFVRTGDLLITRANTVELVGAVAQVYCTPQNLLLPDKIWRFLWLKDTSVLPSYVEATFCSGAIRTELRKLATGTSDSMRNISQAKLLRLMIEVPPLPLQQQFADRVADLRSIIAQQERSLAAASSLEASLMSSLVG